MRNFQNEISKEILEKEILDNKLSTINISKKYHIPKRDIVKLQKIYKLQILNIDGKRVPRQLSYEQKQLILGSCFGNGVLFKNKNGCGLKICFPNKYCFYVDLKFNVLRPYIRTSPTIHVSKFKDKSCLCKSFKTLTHDYFTFLYDGFHDKCGNIHIYENLLDKLDVCGLSVLFMDVGIKKKYSCDFLLNFGYEDQVVFSKWLKDKFNIESRVIKCSSLYKTRILRGSMHKFNETINNFILHDFKFKI